MQKNIGPKDKNIRLIAGIALIIVGFLLSCYLLGLVGIVLIVTALLGFCPAYIPLKKNTLDQK